MFFLDGMVGCFYFYIQFLGCLPSTSCSLFSVKFLAAFLLLLFFLFLGCCVRGPKVHLHKIIVITFQLPIISISFLENLNVLSADINHSLRYTVDESHNPSTYGSIHHQDSLHRHACLLRLQCRKQPLCLFFPNLFSFFSLTLAYLSSFWSQPFYRITRMLKDFISLFRQEVTTTLYLFSLWCRLHSYILKFLTNILSFSVGIHNHGFSLS